MTEMFLNEYKEYTFKDFDTKGKSPKVIREAIVEYADGEFVECKFVVPNNSCYTKNDWKFLNVVSEFIGKNNEMINKADELEDIDEVDLETTEEEEDDYSDLEEFLDEDDVCTQEELNYEVTEKKNV